MEYSLLIVTCPDARTATSIARRLVADRLAACGNVTGTVGTLSAPTETMRATLAEAKADLAVIEKEMK